MDQSRLDYADPECPPGRRARNWLGPLAAVLLTLVACPPLNRDQSEQLEVQRMKALVRERIARIISGLEDPDAGANGREALTGVRYTTGLRDHGAP